MEFPHWSRLGGSTITAYWGRSGTFLKPSTRRRSIAANRVKPSWRNSRKSSPENRRGSQLVPYSCLLPLLGTSEGADATKENRGPARLPAILPPRRQPHTVHSVRYVPRCTTRRVSPHPPGSPRSCRSPSSRRSATARERCRRRPPANFPPAVSPPFRCFTTGPLVRLQNRCSGC